MATKKQHNKEFKLNAVKYIEEHPDLTQEECAKNRALVCQLSATGEASSRRIMGILTRGSGNYESDDKKEFARLKRQLRDAGDAPDVLKKLSAFWGKTDSCHLRGGVSKGGGIQSIRTPRLHLRNAQVPWCFPLRLPCFPQA